MKRFLLLNSLLILFLLLIINYYSYNYILPNTYLGDTKVSGMTFEEVKDVVDKKYTMPVLLEVGGRVYTYNYNDLGVLIDYPMLKNSLFSSKTRFPQSIAYFLESLFTKNQISTPLNFTQKFYQYTSSTIFDFNDQNDEIVVDQNNKVLHFQDFDEKYTIDTNSLKKELALKYSNGETILPSLIKVEPRVKGIVTDYNQHLAWVYQNPVDIVITLPTGEIKNITLSIDDLKRITEIEYNQQNQNLNVSVNQSEFNSLILDFINSVKTDPDKNISIPILTQDLKFLLNTRFSGQEANTLLAKLDFAPNTYGEKADKYIEVDISQQTMYIFSDKNLAKIYKISSGLYYPTPRGEFKILNKAPNAFSDIYNVYMPYWMAFYYGPDLGAYFGIHELPYYVSNGQRVQRPREFIGTPRTGGCIALDIGAAKEVYDFAEIGMPVYVYN